MAGKTRFQILEEALKPYVGQILKLSSLKVLVLRHLGTSSNTVVSHLRWAVEAQLIREVEHMQYEVLNPSSGSL